MVAPGVNPAPLSVAVSDASGSPVRITGVIARAKSAFAGMGAPPSRISTSGADVFTVTPYCSSEELPARSVARRVKRFNPSANGTPPSAKVASPAGVTWIERATISTRIASASVDPAIEFGSVPTVVPFAGARLRMAGGVKSSVNATVRSAT
jgi:hypothetical protein